MKPLKITFLSGLLIIAACCNRSVNTTEPLNPQKMLDYCISKTISTMKNLTDADSIPRNILTEQTKWNKVSVYDWTSGFWPGILWYGYEYSGDSTMLRQARKFTLPLKKVLDVPVDNHDLGFMFFCSFGNGFRLTHDSHYKTVIIRAADSLATLFNPKVGTILSWPSMRSRMGWPHNTIIDNLVNLELLFWASKNGGSQDLYDIAVRHAETCLKTLIRPDYSTYHVAVFDTTDGHFIKGVTHQGYADSSMWARGQAWGIYGYAMCFRETGKTEFQVTAMKLADHFLKRLPEDGIPYWDYDDPAIPDAPKDASAAAIAASGMLELSGLVEGREAKTKYLEAAVRLLTRLSSEDYLSGETNQAFLLHSTGHKPNGTEIDASINYADYYYIEALLRLKKMEQSQAAEYNFSAINRKIQSWIDSGYYSGAGLIISRDNRVILEKYFGNYTSDTVVYIASAGKWLAAATIACLVDEGKLSWDDPVKKWLPEFKDIKGTATLRQLLSHTSGYPDYQPQTAHRDDYQTLKESVAHIAGLPADTVPGTEFNYGGLAMQVAGRMAELATGKDWESLFQEKIALPLGMKNTHFIPVHQGGGHSPMLGGGARTVLQDYAAFLKMISNHGLYNEKRILSEAAITEMQSDQTGNAKVADHEYVERVRAERHKGIYGLGEWREELDSTGNAALISSPSWAGAYPWIDKTTDSYGFFITHVNVEMANRYGFSAFYSSPVLPVMVREIFHNLDLTGFGNLSGLKNKNK
jgi:unsaturated chondroitin disaccharide hydrolase